MYEIFGDYEHALKEIGSIFRLSGKVLPMTLQDAQLKAYLQSTSNDPSGCTVKSIS